MFVKKSQIYPVSRPASAGDVAGDEVRLADAVVGAGRVRQAPICVLAVMTDFPLKFSS